MYSGGRYFYAVFMAHLSVEKMLKGLYHQKLNQIPPKTHNLINLLNKLEIRPPEIIAKFLIKLNEASVSTRYPENLEKISKDYSKERVSQILIEAKEVLKWIKSQF